MGKVHKPSDSEFNVSVYLALLLIHKYGFRLCWICNKLTTDLKTLATPVTGHLH
jgi:hypothetical protein